MEKIKVPYAAQKLEKAILKKLMLLLTTTKNINAMSA